MDQNQWNETQQPQEQPYNFTPPQHQETNGYAIASLILGVVSVVLCSCTCISIVTSILAIVFAIISRKGQPMEGKAIGGMVCGIIALVITIVSVVALILFSVETNAEDLKDFYEGYYGETYGDEFAFEQEDGTHGTFSDMWQ
jgi:uncharacterized membrane protein YkgB